MGGTIPENQMPEVTLGTGDSFLGWMDMQDHMPFHFDTRIHRDYKLYAKTGNAEQFTVTYALDGGSGNAPVDSNRYARGAQAVVLPATGVTPPMGKVFLYWSAAGDSTRCYPGGKLTVTGAHNVTITGETMAADQADIDDISGDLTLIATGEGGMAIRQWISVCVSSNSGEKAIYVGSNRETEQFESRMGDPFVCRSWYPSEAYISVRKAPAYPVTVHGGKLSNSENNTTFYKGETVRVKTSRPEKGLKFNRWFFPADVETTDDPTGTAFFFTMPDHAVEVTANWELYTGSEPTVFWEYYTYSGLLTPDNTPQNPAGMSNMTVSYDSASRTYTVDLKDDLWSPVDFKGNENPNIKVKGELGNSVHISGANNVSIDIDSQNEETNLNVDCAGTLRLKNKTGNSHLELKLTYKQAEGAGYTVVLDGEELEEAPAYENAAVSLNESLTIIPDISDPIPDDSSAGGDSSDAAGALVAAAVGFSA